MRRSYHIPAFCLSLLLLPVLSSAQETKVSCAVQAAVPATDADKAFSAGEFAKAESLYKAQLSPTPTTTAYAGAVRSLIEANRLAEALTTAQAAATAIPNSADAAALIGDVQLRSGEVAEAAATFAKAVGMDHCAPLAHLGLGRIDDLLSRHVTAAKEYSIAYSLAPSNAEIVLAYAGTLPADKKTAALHTLLGSSPTLSPLALDRATAAAAMLDQHATCTPASPNDSAKLPLYGLMLYGTHARSFGVKGRVNNADLPILDLDSSVSGIVLNPNDAKKAGVHPLLAAGKLSPNGLYYAVADHIKIGNLEYKDCPVRVASAAMLANANSLIGTDFFRDHLIHIDYVLKELTLTPYRTPAAAGELTERVIAPEQKDWSPVYLAGSDILVPSFLNKKGPYLFLFDTGSHITIFSPQVTKQALMQVRDANLNLHGSSAAIVKVLPKFGGSDDDHTMVYGADGKLVKAGQPFKVPILQFANNQFNDDEALSFDLTGKSHDSGLEISGLIGFSTLREFFEDIDYRNGLVKIQYDFNHLYTIRDMARDK